MHDELQTFCARLRNDLDSVVQVLGTKGARQAEEIARRYLSDVIRPSYERRKN